MAEGSDDPLRLDHVKPSIEAKSDGLFNGLVGESLNSMEDSEVETKAIRNRVQDEMISNRDCRDLDEDQLLLSFLRDRAGLQPGGFEALKALADTLNKPAIRSAIHVFRNSETPADRPKTFPSGPSKLLREKHTRLHFSTDDQKGSLLTDQVIDLISENIQHDWRNLSRASGLTEVEIQSVESMEESSPAAIARRSLEIFCSKNPSVDRFQKLTDGLVEVRRHNLADKVKNLLAQYPYSD